MNDEVRSQIEEEPSATVRRIMGSSIQRDTPGRAVCAIFGLNFYCLVSTKWGISRPQTMSNSATTSGAPDLHFWPARAGLPTSRTPWPTPSPLEDAYTLVYHDYRGSGRSEVASSATYTYERIADDLDELRVRLGYESVGLLAHSMGGFIGLNYGLRHPEACAGMVLVGATPTGNPGKIAVPALRALGPTRTAKVLALATWSVAGWSWRSESKGKLAARYAAMAVAQEGIPAVRDKVKAAMAGQALSK